MKQITYNLTINYADYMGAVLHGVTDQHFQIFDCRITFHGDHFELLVEEKDLDDERKRYNLTNLSHTDLFASCEAAIEDNWKEIVTYLKEVREQHLEEERRWEEETEQYE